LHPRANRTSPRGIALPPLRRRRYAAVVRTTLCLLFVVGCGTSSVDSESDAAVTPTPLEIDALGVQGFLLRHDGDVVLTAPLFTRASLLDVSLGVATPPDDAAIDAAAAALPFADVRAIVTGHAHYDHLMDVPRIMARHAPDATLYSNMTARHVFAALAPDSCGEPAETIARERVVALDDPAASAVDYRGCPDQAPPGAPLEGTWRRVPNARVRVLALCGVHPDQVGPIHFGAGAIDTDQCELPDSANGWLEGATTSYLIDFLDDDDRPVYRVYYQDAPGTLPIGAPPAEVLADKPVDVALLCVGNYDQVADHPAAILGALDPGLAISGHWEDFFQPADQPEQPLPFTDVDAYVAAADAAAPDRHVLAHRGLHVSYGANRSFVQTPSTSR
jgi:L-ascorbate metabolism protein UlaG (beta-lactamase superfamily)